jgi:serine/threonine-protein kinase
MSDTAQGSWAGSRFGPTLAADGLFLDVASLKNAFNGFTGTVAIVSCPRGTASPGTWWHNCNPNDIFGQIACGTSKDTEPRAMWTNNDNLVFALVAGSLQGSTLD